MLHNIVLQSDHVAPEEEEFPKPDPEDPNIDHPVAPDDPPIDCRHAEEEMRCRRLGLGE